MVATMANNPMPFWAWRRSPWLSNPVGYRSLRCLPTRFGLEIQALQPGSLHHIPDWLTHALDAKGSTAIGEFHIMGDVVMNAPFTGQKFGYDPTAFLHASLVSPD